MNKRGFFHRLSGACQQKKGEWFVKRATKKLELDTVQQNQLTQFVEQFQQDREVIEKARYDTRREIMAFLFEGQYEDQPGQEKTDRDKAKTAVHDSLMSIVKTADVIMDNFSDFIHSLNPQQRQKLHNYINKHRLHRCCLH